MAHISEAGAKKICEIEKAINALKESCAQFEADIASFTERRNEIEKSGKRQQ